MEERKLTFRSHDDKTPVLFDDETKKLASKKIAELYHAISTLKSHVDNDTLTEGFKATMLTCTEMYTMDILRAFGYDGVLEKEKKERYSEIRSLNEQNRELRKQLGEKVSNEDMREGMKNMSRLIRDWWNEKGLGYVKHIVYTEYGHVKVSFGGSYSGIGDTDAAEREHIKYLSDYGFQHDNGGDSERFQLIDNDHNRELFIGLVQSRFPSASLETVTNWSGRGKVLQLREAEFYIRNLDDLK